MPKTLEGNDFYAMMLACGDIFQIGAVRPAGFMLLHVTAQQVRLANGSSPFEGRVEVFYQGVWGTVCDTFWGLDDANVVCRQLGYGKALAAPGGAAFGQGTGRIWLTWVQCKGNEDSISDCRHDGWGQTRGCDHDEDASARCSSPVKLVGGVSPKEGLVQVYYNNTWGSICGQTWDKKNADVVCRMLGYLRSSEPRNGADYGKGNGTVWLNSVQCTGTENSLFSCVNDGWRNHTCTSGKEANVSCIGPDVRLVNGGLLTSVGRVEVLYGGLWGAVCDERWDLDDANVVCHQLGYPDAVSAPRDSQFGEGTGVIWINEVECTGREDSLTKCSHSGWGKANCWHNDVASAICSKPVRLTGGKSNKEGLVQVYHSNAW
ncbi:hypothetical protein ACROYT_G029080 [Oculina patagonica]